MYGCNAPLYCLRLLFDSVDFAKNRSEKFWIYNKYNFHSYLLMQDMLTIISAAAATINTHFVGKTVAVNIPRPNATAHLILFEQQFTVSPFIIVYTLIFCVMKTA